MFIAWQPSTSALFQMGFSAGDLAAMAGAGRGIVTWLTAKYKDTALLDFLDVTPEDLILRKGLLDTVNLRERWGRNIKLFKDNKVFQIKLKTKLNVNYLMLFTWVLTLVSAALEASVSIGDYQYLLAQFVLMLFDENPLEEHLNQEIDAHREGWRSISTVYQIRDRAQEEWIDLALRNEHPMGNVPKSDGLEIMRLLRWITKDQERRFYTSSCDVFCIAKVLQAIGFDCLKTWKSNLGPTPDFDEKYLVVFLKADAIGSTVHTPRLIRKGMPVPLSQPDEVVMFWPYSRRSFENPLQDVFQRGMHAAKGLVFTPGILTDDQNAERKFESCVCYTVTSTVEEVESSLRGPARSFASQYFPFINDETARWLTNLTRHWRHAKDDEWTSRSPAFRTAALHADQNLMLRRGLASHDGCRSRLLCTTVLFKSYSFSAKVLAQP